MACIRWLEAWRIGIFSCVRAVRCGRFDTTSGVLLFVVFSAGGLRACLARLICCCTVVSL